MLLFFRILLSCFVSLCVVFKSASFIVKDYIFMALYTWTRYKVTQVFTMATQNLTNVIINVVDKAHVIKRCHVEVVKTLVKSFQNLNKISFLLTLSELSLSFLDTQVVTQDFIILQGNYGNKQGCICINL